jgi:hypothetical protein
MFARRTSALENCESFVKARASRDLYAGHAFRGEEASCMRESDQMYISGTSFWALESQSVLQILLNDDE